MKTVTASIVNGFHVKSEARGHEIHADEPKDVGGTDLAQKPGEILLSALASCKAITCKMYAQRKQWDVQDIRITLTIRDEAPKVIEKSIEFIGDLDEDKKERLLEISGRCPVAKLIDPSIEYKIV